VAWGVARTFVRDEQATAAFDALVARINQLMNVGEVVQILDKSDGSAKTLFLAVKECVCAYKQALAKTSSYWRPSADIQTARDHLKQYSNLFTDGIRTSVSLHLSEAVTSLLDSSDNSSEDGPKAINAASFALNRWDPQHMFLDKTAQQEFETQQVARELHIEKIGSCVAEFAGQSMSGKAFFLANSEKHASLFEYFNKIPATEELPELTHAALASIRSLILECVTCAANTCTSSLGKAIGDEAAVIYTIDRLLKGKDYANFTTMTQPIAARFEVMDPAALVEVCDQLMDAGYVNFSMRGAEVPQIAFRGEDLVETSNNLKFNLVQGLCLGHACCGLKEAASLKQGISVATAQVTTSKSLAALKTLAGRIKPMDNAFALMLATSHRFEAKSVEREALEAMPAETTLAFKTLINSSVQSIVYAAATAAEKHYKEFVSEVMPGKDGTLGFVTLIVNERQTEGSALWGETRFYILWAVGPANNLWGVGPRGITFFRERRGGPHGTAGYAESKSL